MIKSKPRFPVLGCKSITDPLNKVSRVWYVLKCFFFQGPIISKKALAAFQPFFILFPIISKKEAKTHKKSSIPSPNIFSNSKRPNINRTTFYWSKSCKRRYRSWGFGSKNFDNFWSALEITKEQPVAFKEMREKILILSNNNLFIKTGIFLPARCVSSKKVKS